MISHISSQSNTIFVIIFPPLTNVFYSSSLALMAKTVFTSSFVERIPVDEKETAHFRAAYRLDGSEEVGGLNLTASEIEVKAAGSIVLLEHMFDPATRLRPDITLKR